jgi:hypothetical protein
MALHSRIDESSLPFKDSQFGSGRALHHCSKSQRSLGSDIDCGLLAQRILLDVSAGLLVGRGDDTSWLSDKVVPSHGRRIAIALWDVGVILLAHVERSSVVGGWMIERVGLKFE